MYRHSQMLTLNHSFGGMRQKLSTSLFILAALFLSSAIAFGHPCKLTRDFRKTTTSDNEELHVVDSPFPLSVDCSSRDIVRIPTNIESDANKLNLSGNRILKVRSNDFANVPNLRELVLSHNSIRTLERRCFRQLRNLERLDLNNNDVTSFSPEVFIGLYSLRVLTMNRLPLTSYPTHFVGHTPELRLLSMSAIRDANIPAEYARLPRLEVLDFYGDIVKLTRITAAMFDNVRDSDIKTLSFRNMKHLREIEAGAFSNLPNTRSLIIAFNERLSFRKTVSALAATTNTIVDNVVLDGASRDKMTIFSESEFCSSFWRGVRRLSVRGTSLLGFAFANTRCLAQLRELIVDYNSPILVQPISPDFPAIFAKLKTLSGSHRTLRSDAYHHAYGHSCDVLWNAGDYFPTRPPALTTANVDDTNACTHNKFLNLPPSLEFLHISDVRCTSRWNLNGSYCFGNIRYLNASHNQFAKVLCKGCRIVGNNRLEIFDLSHGTLETITSDFFNFPSLRYLNLSYNALGVSGSDFRETFRHLVGLEDLNLSGNKISRINPEAFVRCTRLQRLHLANNQLVNVDLNIRPLTSLEYIDLSNNYLMRLSDIFMTKLDQRFKLRPFEINIRSHMLICNHKSISFVRWTRVTCVRLTDKDQLTCSYNGRHGMTLREMAVDKIGRKCSFPFKAVIVPVVVGLVIFVAVFALLRYQRWYVLHKLAKNHLRGTKAPIYIQPKHPKEALLYLRAIKSRDKQSGFATILKWDGKNDTPLKDEKLGVNARDGDCDV